MNGRNLFTVTALAALLTACGNGCGGGAPDASPPTTHVCSRTDDAGNVLCCDGGHWTCATLEVPCVCPKD